MSCYVIWNGQAPIPFDMDYSVVPELDIPKHIEGVTSEEMEHQQFLSSYTDDIKDVRDYGYGTPANHNPKDWKHLARMP